MTRRSGRVERARKGVSRWAWSVIRYLPRDSGQRGLWQDSRIVTQVLKACSVRLQRCSDISKSSNDGAASLAAVEEGEAEVAGNFEGVGA